jgi:hypothetical protein
VIEARDVIGERVTTTHQPLGGAVVNGCQYSTHVRFFQRVPNLIQDKTVTRQRVVCCAENGHDQYFG